MSILHTIFVKPIKALNHGLKLRDLIKFVPLAALSIYFLRDDPNLPIFLSVLGLITLFAIASHIIRKVIFWGHSTDELYKKALGTPLGAAICYFGICYFLATVFASTILYLK